MTRFLGMAIVSLFSSVLLLAQAPVPEAALPTQTSSSVTPSASVGGTDNMTVDTLRLPQLRLTRDPFSSIPILLDDRFRVSADRKVTPLKSTGIRLTGIVWDQVDPIAMMNVKGKRQMLRVGDTVDVYLVISITRSYVQLQSESKEFILKVGKEILL